MKPFNCCRWCFFALVFLLPLGRLQAQAPPSNTNLLNSWSFWDTNAWHSDLDYGPINFTNLSASMLGDGTALVLNSTNFACLRYNVTESSGTNNLRVDVGSVILWMRPGWASVSQGGAGPGQWGRLVEAGTYTTNASYGWWSLYLDAGGTNIYFSVQTNNGNGATYLAAPISWTTNDWHQVALSYSSSNCSLYVDGTLLTNGAGVAYWPGPAVLTNGFCIGSDSTGVAQVRATIDDVATYNIPLNTAAIQADYESYFIYYSLLNPLIWENITSAPYTNTVTPVFNAVTGTGNLTPGGTNATACVASPNIWFTNMVARTLTNGTQLTFLIGGGADGILYDVFANSVPASPSDTNRPWAWMGQAYHCVTNTLTLTNQPNTSAFLILGTPQDSDSDGLTDAYELLVSKTRFDVWDTDGDGMSDGQEVQLGTNPLVDETVLTASRFNFIYDPAGRLKQVTGKRSESVGFDAEGNVQLDQ